MKNETSVKKLLSRDEGGIENVIREGASIRGSSLSILVLYWIFVSRRDDIFDFDTPPDRSSLN